MDPHAVVQAAARLDKAERSLNALRKAANFEEAEDAWTDFLLAASTIYSKLQQGAKGNGQSVGWFGRQTKIRKDNPVLRYIHFARNSDEHGIRRVTERSPDNWWLGRKLAFGQRIEQTIYRTDKITLEPIGDPVKAWACGPFIQLVRAHDDRYGDHCDPPRLGERMGTSPIDVAEAALPLLRALVEEAADLV